MRPIADTACSFPSPGRPLVVHWNEFRSLLESQIAHPERLRDSHRVGVRAQVYELTRPQSLGELAESITGDRDRVSELTILTDTLAALLDYAASATADASGLTSGQRGNLDVDGHTVRLQLVTIPRRPRRPLPGRRLQRP